MVYATSSARTVRKIAVGCKRGPLAAISSNTNHAADLAPANATSSARTVKKIAVGRKRGPLAAISLNSKIPKTTASKKKNHKQGPLAPISHIIEL